MARVATTMETITAGSSKISEITALIEGISFQSNILALNASVEAARAGEHGRGFAVVATEVRTLAQRTSAAAKEIKDLVRTSAAGVVAGASEVDDARWTIDQVVHAVRQAALLVADISHASAEQSAGIEQVNRAVTQLDQVTQQNAALVEQAAAASESLREQGESLTHGVEGFKLTDQSCVVREGQGAERR